MSFETYYNYLYSFILFMIQMYKGLGGIDKNAGSHLNYPPNIWGFEVTCVIVFFLFQAFRLDHGLRANRNENKIGMIAFLGFTVFSIIFYMYFMRFTTFVLVVEGIFGVIGMAFPVMEFFLIVLTINKLTSQTQALN
jgi:fumarate reductase subunit D